MARIAQISLYTVLKDAGFKKAEKYLKSLRFQANGLNSSFAKLGLGIGVTQFARTSVAAALQMEQANSRLAVSLTNIGKAGMATSASVKASEKSMMALGFEGTQTADALSSLVTATGSLEKSQGMLAASADLARFNNTDLATSAKLLAKLTGGNARAFTEMNITLDKTLPRAKALEKAMAMLNAKIGGQAAAYVLTFAGRLDVLKAKFQNFQSQIGEQLLPTLVKFGDFLVNTGIPKLQTFFTMMIKNKDAVIGMALALEAVALAFKSIGTFAAIAKVEALPILIAAAPFVIAAAALIAGVGYISNTTPKKSEGSVTQQNYDTAQGLSKQYGGKSVLKPADILHNPGDRWDGKRWIPFGGSPIPGMNKGKAVPAGVDRQALQLAKETAASAKKAAALAAAAAAKKLAAERAITADKKLSAQFDVNQIALANALKLDLTAKEKAAIEGLIALQDDGYKTETQRMLEQEAALRKLISLKNDYASIAWDKSTSLGGGEKQISTPVTAAIASLGGDFAAASNPSLSSQPALIPTSTMSTSTSAADDGGYTSVPAPIVNLTVQGSVVTEQDLLNTIYEGLGNKLRAGATWYSNAASG